MQFTYNPEVALAERYVVETGVSIFLTGKAGTGKTTFLHNIVETCHKRSVVVAPTGVAAINAGGVTIHSFFQLPFCPYLPDIPELFKNISVTFVAEGNTVAVIDVDFGGSIDELPEVERKGTLYWKWNDFDDDHIYYSQTVEGEYKAPKTTISTNEEVPLFLAEGNFYDGQELTVVPDTEDISISGEKGTLAGAYKLNVNGADSILKIRMKMPDKGKLYMYSDDKWSSLDYKTDGSYIVFDMKNGGEIAFFKKYHAANIPVWAIITAAVSAAAIIAAVIIIKKNAKKKKAAVPKG